MEDMFYKRESFVCCAQHCGGFQGLCVVSTFIRGMLVVWSAAGSSILTHLFFYVLFTLTLHHLPLYILLQKRFFFSPIGFGLFFCNGKLDLQ